MKARCLTCEELIETDEWKWEAEPHDSIIGERVFDCPGGLCCAGDDCSPVDAARERHGKPFSHEKGSKWRPHEVPVLTAWMQGRGKK